VRSDRSPSRGDLIDRHGSETGVVVVAKSGTILFANPRAAEILGADTERFLQRPVHTLLPPLVELIRDSSNDDRDASAEPASKCWQLHNGASGPIDVVFETVALPVVLEGGAVGEHLVLFRDITAVLELEGERDRLMQLAAVSETLPSLLHELKNPLAAISTTLEVMIEELQPGDLQSDLHAILAEVRRVVLSCDGLGTVGRSWRTRGAGAIDLAIREAFRVLEPRAQTKGVRTQCRVADMPLLPLDVTVTRAIIFNLINNAIHACRAGEDIELSASLDQETQHLAVVVRDSGRGMRPEVKRRCTELFFSTKPSGSGIGLALCSRVVAEAGGTLEIDSAPEHGTTIRVVVPLAANRHNTVKKGSNSQ